MYHCKHPSIPSIPSHPSVGSHFLSAFHRIRHSGGERSPTKHIRRKPSVHSAGEKEGKISLSLPPTFVATSISIIQSSCKRASFRRHPPTLPSQHCPASLVSPPIALERSNSALLRLFLFPGSCLAQILHHQQRRRRRRRRRGSGRRGSK
jgi:hypothetical protein